MHMVQRVPLPLTVSCFRKIQIGFTFLVPAHPGSPGQRAVKRMCVCTYLLTYLLTDRRRQFTLCIRHRQSVRVADALCRCRMARHSLQSRSDTSARAQRQPARRCPVSATNCPSLAIIAKFHYTDPTGPDPTRQSPCGSGRVRVMEFSFNRAATDATRKTEKYSTLSSAYRFKPIAVENLSVFSSTTLNFIYQLGRRICVHTGDARETSYLFQRISIMLQRFNSVLLHDTAS